MTNNTHIWHILAMLWTLAAGTYAVLLLGDHRRAVDASKKRKTAHAAWLAAMLAVLSPALWVAPEVFAESAIPGLVMLERPFMLMVAAAWVPIALLVSLRITSARSTQPRT